MDNSPVMRRVIERSLRLAGLEGARILDAGDGAEALELARQQSVDLVLTELDLPTMSGLDLLRQLRAEAATGDLPVLIVSSNSAQSLVLESLRLGAAGFLRKPFTIDQMKEYAIPLLHPPRFA